MTERTALALAGATVAATLTGMWFAGWYLPTRAALGAGMVLLQLCSLALRALGKRLED